MKLPLNLGITVMLLLGCTSESPTTFLGKNPVTVKFEKSYNLDGTIIPLEILGTQNIYILDSLLAITTPQRDTLYHLVSLPGFKQKKSFIRKGGGPNEFESALRPLAVEKKGDDLLISFYHRARQGIFHFNLTQSWLHDIDIFQDTIKLEKLNEIYRAYNIDNESIFVDNLDFLNLNQLYAVYQWKNQYITRLDTAVVSGLSDQKDSYLMASATIFDKSKRKYAGGMMFMDQLNIYDIENPEKSIAITSSSSPESLSDASRTIMPLKKEYYVDLRAGNGFLFGLYANQNRKAWAMGDTPAEIHVLDWDGNALCKLTTKEKLIHICIDPVNHTLYGLAEKDEIYSYNLNIVPELAN